MCEMKGEAHSFPYSQTSYSFYHATNSIIPEAIEKRMGKPTSPFLKDL